MIAVKVSPSWTTKSLKISRGEGLTSLLDQYLQKSELDMPFLVLLLPPAILVFMKMGIKKCNFRN